MRKIAAEAVQGVFTDEGEAGEPAQLVPAHGPVKRALRRLHVGVGVQDHPRPRGQRDQGRGRQMIFDNRKVDAAAPEKPRDAPGFPKIAANAWIGNRRDFDALEGPIHRRANDERRARIAAVQHEVANAKLDRSRKPRPEMRVAQQDVGDFRLARHRHTGS